MNTYFDGSGKRIQLGNLLGKGGEACVYDIVGQPKLAAKIYRNSPSTETIQKLYTLIKMQAISNTAWPLKLIFEDCSANKVTGYVMAKVSGCKTWSNFNVEVSRAQVSGYKYTPTFFYNMLTSFVKTLNDIHATGLIVGDINDSNILVERNGDCTVIDVDSFQVNTTSLLCTVGRPEFLDRRLQGASLQSTARDELSDHFAMGVLFWQLIFSTHPYQGMGEPTSITERIKANLHVGSKLYMPPKFQHDYNKLPISILKLFMNSFNLVPTTSQAWLSELATYEDELEAFIKDSLKLNISQAKHSKNSTSKASYKSIFISSVKYAISAFFCLVLLKFYFHFQSVSVGPIPKEPESVFQEKERKLAEQHIDAFGKLNNDGTSKQKVAESFIERHKNVFKVKENIQ